MHVNNQNRLRSLSSQASSRQTTGVIRENKVAPIFKYDMATGETIHGRAIAQPRQIQPSPTPQTSGTRTSLRPGIARSANARSISNVTPATSARVVQAQMVQGPYKYIPLHMRAAIPARDQTPVTQFTQNYGQILTTLSSSSSSTTTTTATGQFQYDDDTAAT